MSLHRVLLRRALTLVAFWLAFSLYLAPLVSPGIDAAFPRQRRGVTPALSGAQ